MRITLKFLSLLLVITLIPLPLDAQAFMAPSDDQIESAPMPEKTVTAETSAIPVANPSVSPVYMNTLNWLDAPPLQSVSEQASSMIPSAASSDSISASEAPTAAPSVYVSTSAPEASPSNEEITASLDEEKLEELPPPTIEPLSKEEQKTVADRIKELAHYVAIDYVTTLWKDIKTEIEKGDEADLDSLENTLIYAQEKIARLQEYEAEILENIEKIARPLDKRIEDARLDSLGKIGGMGKLTWQPVYENGALVDVNWDVDFDLTRGGLALSSRDRNAIRSEIEQFIREAFSIEGAINSWPGELNLSAADEAKKALTILKTTRGELQEQEEHFVAFLENRYEQLSDKLEGVMNCIDDADACEGETKEEKEEKRESFKRNLGETLKESAEKSSQLEKAEYFVLGEPSDMTPLRISAANLISSGDDSDDELRVYTTEGLAEYGRMAQEKSGTDESLDAQKAYYAYLFHFSAEGLQLQQRQQLHSISAELSVTEAVADDAETAARIKEILNEIKAADVTDLWKKISDELKKDSPDYSSIETAMAQTVDKIAQLRDLDDGLFDIVKDPDNAKDEAKEAIELLDKIRKTIQEDETVLYKFLQYRQKLLTDRMEQLLVCFIDVDKCEGETADDRLATQKALKKSREEFEKVTEMQSKMGKVEDFIFKGSVDMSWISAAPMTGSFITALDDEAPAVETHPLWQPLASYDPDTIKEMKDFIAQYTGKTEALIMQEHLYWTLWGFLDFYYVQRENRKFVSLDSALVMTDASFLTSLSFSQSASDSMPLTSEFVMPEMVSGNYAVSFGDFDDEEKERQLQAHQKLVAIDRNAPHDREPVLPDLSSKTQEDVIDIAPLELIEMLLWANPGIFLGEAHGDKDPPEFVVENMTKLKEMDVEVLFLEMVYSVNQKLIDDYYKDENALDKLSKNMINAWSDHGEETVKRYVEIIKAAKKAGIKVVAIDVPYTAEPYSSFERLVTSNPAWYKTITQYLKDNNIKKYIVYGGSNHSDTGSPKGIDYMLGIPSIDFKMGEFALVIKRDNGENNYQITLKAAVVDQSISLSAEPLPSSEVFLVGSSLSFIGAEIPAQQSTTGLDDAVSPAFEVEADYTAPLISASIEEFMTLPASFERTLQEGLTQISAEADDLAEE